MASATRLSLRRIVACITFLGAVVALRTPALAADRPLLHPLFSDHAVVQRDRPLPVWGWTDPGAAVDVQLGDDSRHAVADADGRWEITFPACQLGDPFNLRVTSGERTATSKDLVAGDVWLCSGQSNMAWMLRSSGIYKSVIAESDNDRLRLFKVPGNLDMQPRDTPDTQWAIAGPETTSTFSGVGYFFGALLQRELDIPIGLIEADYGGSSIEAWISWDRLAEIKAYEGAVRSLRAVTDGRDPITSYKQDMAAWYAAHDLGEKENWQDVGAEDASWDKVRLPSDIESTALGEFDGIVWFRTTLTLDRAWVGRDASIKLGAIDDRDTVWVNGKRVGGSDRYSRPRSYSIPAGTLVDGANTIAIRVLDTGGGGGFYGKPDELYLEQGDRKVSLATEWSYRASARLSDVPGPPTPSADGVARNQLPGLAYHGMIAPLGPVALRGVVWYQGETMTTSPERYGSLMLPTLAGEWRKRFRNDDLPFGIVQLPNWGKPTTKPVTGGWPDIRAAQARAAEEIPNAFLAVTIDSGEADNIHPKLKQPVGERLARRALAVVYGRDDPATGPQLVSSRADGKRFRLKFRNTAGSLTLRPAEGQPSGFALAGPDGQWHWAEARVEGDEIILESADVQSPAAARYAWAANPPLSLFGKDGLPAAPFRTD